MRAPGSCVGFTRSLKVESEEARQDLVIGEVRRPTVGSKDGGV
jgi:hypothetical protein